MSREQTQPCEQEGSTSMAPVGSGPASASPGLGSSESIHWKCSVCTCWNSNFHANCLMCLTVRNGEPDIWELCPYCQTLFPNVDTHIVQKHPVPTS